MFAAIPMILSAPVGGKLPVFSDIRSSSAGVVVYNLFLFINLPSHVRSEMGTRASFASNVKDPSYHMSCSSFRCLYFHGLSSFVVGCFRCCGGSFFCCDAANLALAAAKPPPELRGEGGVEEEEPNPPFRGGGSFLVYDVAAGFRLPNILGLSAVPDSSDLERPRLRLQGWYGKVWYMYKY